MEEIFTRGLNKDIFSKLAQLFPEVAKLIIRAAFLNNSIRAFMNAHLLPLVSTKQLSEMPNMWLLNRVHSIIEQRQQTPTSRVDLLQLMLPLMTDESIKVSQSFQPLKRTVFLDSSTNHLIV